MVSPYARANRYSPRVASELPADPAADPPPHRLRLAPVVFVSGAGSLATEICASRLLAPYFGQSTVVWANIIGLVLIYLSAGYWLGGRFADRWPNAKVLAGVILVAAVLVAILPFVSKPVLQVAQTSFGGAGGGIAERSFTSVLLLFAIPVTLLGTVTPWALRLALTDVTTAGTVAGRLYSLSTIGSIIGTFIPALVTIPLIGTQRTLIGAGALLCLAAVPLVSWRALVVAALVAAMLLIPTSAIKPVTGLLLEQDSTYQYIQVVQDDKGVRKLQTDEGNAAQSVWYPNSVLTGGEWDTFLLMPPLVTHPVRRVLVIGNAGGTIARSFAKYYPDAQIDGVELDGAVTDAGRQYLGISSNPRLNVITADGRTYLDSTSQTYDLIIVDAYHTIFVPFHLATQEFFQSARDHLTPGGVVAINVVDLSTDNALFTAIEGTMRSVIPNAWAWHELPVNETVFAINAPPDSSAALAARVTGVDRSISSLAPLFASQVHRAASIDSPMTDDRAPLDWIVDRAVLGFADTRTGSGAHLPTLPN